MPDVTHVVVRLPLTEKDRRAAAVVEQRVPADIALVFSAVARALGTPVLDIGLETVAWGLEGDIRPGKSFIAWPAPPSNVDGWNVALVRRSDALCQIAIRAAEIATRDAKIAELTALRGAIDYLRTENARLQDTLGRMRSGSVARTVAGSNAEQPGRSRAVGEAWS